MGDNMSRKTSQEPEIRTLKIGDSAVQVLVEPLRDKKWKVSLLDNGSILPIDPTQTREEALNAALRYIASKN